MADSPDTPGGEDVLDQAELTVDFILDHPYVADGTPAQRRQFLKHMHLLLGNHLAEAEAELTGDAE